MPKSKRKTSQKVPQTQSPPSSEEDESQVQGYDFSGSRLMKGPEMVKLATYYIMIVKGKMPAKKSEIIKYAMNKQTKDFPEVIKETAKGLRKVFGLKLIGLKTGPNDAVTLCTGENIADGNSYFVVNCKRQPVIAKVSPDQNFSKDAIQAALFLILSCSYMMDKTLDEDTIWHILEKMNFTKALKLLRREDLRKFLKTEYVDQLYLVKHEIRDTEEVIFRYGWGIRADVELNKYVVLKIVSQALSRNPIEFSTHYKRIPKSDMDKIDQEEKAKKTEPQLETSAPTQKVKSQDRVDNGERMDSDDDESDD